MNEGGGPAQILLDTSNLEVLDELISLTLVSG
jgi:hypothetical protein